MAVNRSKADGFMLRFPEGMRERVRVAAEANGRSMNAEIIARLENSFSNTPAEQIEVQGKLIEEQRDALRKAGKIIDETMDELKSAGGYLAVFARVIDTAAKGDTTMLEGFLEAARTKPLSEKLDIGSTDEQPPKDDK